MSEAVRRTFRRGRPRGFRISSADVLVLFVAAALYIASRATLGHLALIFVIVPLHFFLFCNVFRIHRSAELIWAAAFALNVAAWASDAPLAWTSVLLIQTPITAVLIYWAFRRDDYHGVLWRHAPRHRVLHTPASEN